MAGLGDDVTEDGGATITARYRRLASTGTLDERARRLWAANEARSAGASAVADATGIAESTIRRGLRELDRGHARPPPGRIRRPGAGRPPIDRREPGLLADLERLIDPPEPSPLRWTCLSAARLADALRERGHRVADRTVLRLLATAGYTLHANRPTGDGARHPDRHAQFEFVGRLTAAAIAAAQPVIAVEVRRRDPRARVWRPAGVTAETAPAATSTILAWWRELGRVRFPGAANLTVVADRAGLRSGHPDPWTGGLARIADGSGLELAVCHFPAGTSRWELVAHRLVRYLGPDGAPKDHQVLVELIATGGRHRSPAACTWIDTREAGAPPAPASPPVRGQSLAAPADWNYRIKPSVI
jgi:hypothetical protein